MLLFVVILTVMCSHMSELREASETHRAVLSYSDDFCFPEEFWVRCAHSLPLFLHTKFELSPIESGSKCAP